MHETEQIEEELDPLPALPEHEEPVVVNPDVVVRRLRLGWRRRGKRLSDKGEPKALLCLACMVGQHRKCLEHGCPCAHRQVGTK